MIYVVGSVNMDMVFELSAMPKAGETVTSKSFNTYCGGKGANQAVAIAKLSGKVEMIACVGSDSYGKLLKDNLNYHGVGTQYVRECKGSSGLAAILVQKGQNRIILDGGANMLLSESDIENGLKNAKKGDILVAQLEVPLNIVEFALKKAKEKGMTTLLNPAPAVKLSNNIYSYTDIIAPNETETDILTGVNPVDIVHVALAVKKFYETGVQNVIITLGKRGAAVSHGMNITEIDAQKVKAIDTTAAGDTFIGAVCVKMQNGEDLVSACKFASVAAGITVTRKGAAISIPTIAEVEAKIKELII